MSEPLGAILFLALGAAFVAVGAYLFRLYRSTFMADPRATMTRDLISVLTFGWWSPPPILAAIMFYMGGVCVLIGLLVIWSWMRY